MSGDAVVKDMGLSCQDCRFSSFYVNKEGVMKEDGFCRRYAPRATQVREDELSSYFTVFPLVGCEDWCGEFEAKSNDGTIRGAKDVKHPMNVWPK